MGTRTYGPYRAPAFVPFSCGSDVFGSSDSQPVNAAIANYAQTRRNVMAITANVDSVVPLVHREHYDEIESLVEFTAIPIRDRIILNGQATDNKLKVYIRYNLNADGSGANKCYMRCYVGSRWAEVALTNAAAAWATATIDFEDEGYFTPGPHGFSNLAIYFRTDGTNTVNVHCICVHQPGDTGSPTWVDIGGANCKLGTDDWPHSAFKQKLLTDAVKAVRGNRTVKSNVFCHWYRDFYKTGNAYGGSNDQLGRYKVIKREGVTDMILHCCCYSDDKVNAFTLRAEISGTAGSDGNQTLNFTQPADDYPSWDSFTFTFVGTDIAAEVEFDLLIDAKDNGHGIAIYVPGICMVEKHIDASVTHTVPDTDNTRAGTVQGASEADNMQNTLVHLWEGGGMAIALADWRFGWSPFAYDDRLHLDQAAVDKKDYGPTGTSLAVRALAFPSTGVVRYRMIMGYITTSGSAQTKTIEFQVSDNKAPGSYDEIGPGPDRDIDFLDAEETDTQVVVSELDVASGDWETPAGELGVADVPLQLWMFGTSTDGAAEYVKPKWMTITEVPLGESDFP